MAAIEGKSLEKPEYGGLYFQLNLLVNAGNKNCFLRSVDPNDIRKATPLAEKNWHTRIQYPRGNTQPRIICVHHRRLSSLGSPLQNRSLRLIRRFRLHVMIT